MDKNNKHKELFFVAVKVFFTFNGKLLVLKDKFGQWDLPGGRIKINEFNKPLSAIVKRKIREELGQQINYQVNNQPNIFIRHKRKEKVGSLKEAKIFALGFKAKFLKGTINLSPAHTTYLWVSKSQILSGKLLKGGWLKGAKDYFINY
jgi:hypothetical protein